MADFLLSHEAAELLRCTPANVRELARSGKLPAARIGHIRVFLRADVEALKRARERQSTKREAVGTGRSMS